MREAGRPNWKWLLILLAVCWPLSLIRYAGISRAMKRRGIENWGGSGRCWYLGMAVVLIPFFTFLWAVALILLCCMSV